MIEALCFDSIEAKDLVVLFPDTGKVSKVSKRGNRGVALGY
jgi:hypothetical protein